jgi:hypothetical protein
VASKARFIKLGQGGEWEDSCIEEGTIRIGYWSGEHEVFELCLASDWARLRSALASRGRSGGKLTEACNELKYFLEDDGSILWITFVRDHLHWGFLEPGPPWRHPGGDGMIRKVAGGWKCSDISGNELFKDRLSGALTQVVGFQGTSCSVDAEYVVRRVNGMVPREVEAAIAAREAAWVAIVGLLRRLTPKDFELLVDLVFSSSGWRRQGVLGKTQKDIDLSLLLPSTGERACVQVKSSTTQRQLDEYMARFDASFTKIFWVFHTGNASSLDERVTVLGPRELAPLVLNAGLMDWLIERTS